MRQLTEILRYAAEAPKGDPVPITKSEIPVVAAFVQRGQRFIDPDGPIDGTNKEAVKDGRFTLNEHRVVVL